MMDRKERELEKELMTLKVEIESVKGDIKEVKNDICWIKKMLIKQEKLVYLILVALLSLSGIKIGLDNGTHFIMGWWR